MSAFLQVSRMIPKNRCSNLWKCCRLQKFQSFLQSVIIFNLPSMSQDNYSPSTKSQASIPKKRLVPLCPKWPVCVDFSLNRNSRSLLELLCSCLGCPVNDFSVRLSRTNKQFLFHQRIHRLKN